jgi:hypothetical protein
MEKQVRWLLNDGSGLCSCEAGKPEVIPGQKSAGEKFAGIGTDKR